jgi:hypothetical protein
VFCEVLVRCISERPWLHIPDEMSMCTETSYYLPPGYRLEREPDVLTLRRSDGSFVGAFSARGVSEQALLQLAKDDRLGYPAYTGPQEHADSVRRMLRARMESPWERFLWTEWRMLETRRTGQLAKALAWRLPGESQEELDRMVSEDRRTAKEGLLELRSEEGELSYKHIDQLSPEHRIDRLRAELARIEWLLERQGRRNVVRRWASLGKHPSRKSQGSIHLTA